MFRRAVGRMTGARYQIAVDGQPRSNRDDKAIAIEAAEYLKYKHPHAEVTVHAWLRGTRSPSRPCRPAARHDPSAPPRRPGRLRRDPQRRDGRAHLPHEGRTRALAMDDQVVG